MTRREQCRAAQRRYEQTAKGQAVRRRYLDSAHGRATVTRSTRRRVAIGQRYMGRVATVEQAQAINAHIKRRLFELVTRQSARAEAESL